MEKTTAEKAYEFVSELWRIQPDSMKEVMEAADLDAYDVRKCIDYLTEITTTLKRFR